MGVALGATTGKIFKTWSQDAKDATTWTTDEKLLLAKFNLVGIDLTSTLNKYFGIILSTKKHFNGDIGDLSGVSYGDTCDMFTTTGGKNYFASLDNLKKYLLPDLNTNVKDALTKILTGEGIIQPTPVTIQQVVSTTPVTVSGTTSTANTSTSTATALDNLINVASSQKTNQQEVIARLNGYKNANQYGLVSAVLSMPNSSDAIDSAVSIVGLPPFSSNGSWNDTMLQFFALVKYLRTYPLPTLKTTCTSAHTVLLTLNDELTSIDKNRVIAGSDDNFNRAYVVAVNTIKQEYDGFYSKNDCELKISQQSTKYAADTSNKITEKNIDYLNQNYDSSTSNASKYIMYGLGGVAVLVVILVAVKLIKK